MALVVEDGTGIDGAESYVTLEYLNAYHLARGNSQCDALGKYWYDGTCNANAEPVAPEEPTTTTSGPILRIGAYLLRVGDSVLRAQG